DVAGDKGPIGRIPRCDRRRREPRPSCPRGSGLHRRVRWHQESRDAQAGPFWLPARPSDGGDVPIRGPRVRPSDRGRRGVFARSPADPRRGVRQGDPCVPLPLHAGQLRVRFGAAFWIQRTDWPGLRDACLAAERAGWDTIWLDDHLLSDEASPDDPKLEGWASLHAVASVTSRARLGLLVSSTTFRNPGVIAKLATTLDHVSGGRAVLGLGGGWFDREHEAFGIDFGSGL